MGKPSVHLISNDNGVGLTIDMLLLEGMLTEAGYDVKRVHWKQQVMDPCDIAIFLEMFSPVLAKYARRRVGIFNLEWFPNVWRVHLKGFDQLWAKSREAQEIYRRANLASHLTGFLSQDLYDGAVERTETCLHLRGKSSLKGTEAVLEAWMKYRNLPPLTIVANGPLNVPPGVRLLGRIPQDELVREMNTHRIHLCASKSEGWGHYISEGMSTGATVITTNASPMNDHVQPGRGFLVPVKIVRPRHMAFEYHVTAADLAGQVRAAAALGPDEQDAVGEAAQEHVRQSNDRFRSIALDLLNRLGP